jgi:parallel beta-helix repeat protein
MLLAGTILFSGMAHTLGLDSFETINTRIQPMSEALQFESIANRTRLKLDAVYIAFMGSMSLRANLTDDNGRPVANETIDFGLLLSRWTPTSGWFPVGSDTTDESGLAYSNFGLAVPSGNYSARARHEESANFGASEDIVGFEVPSTREIYIRSDGTIEPSNTPIQSKDDVYTLTGNITGDFDGITIERDNIILNGAGYTIQNTHLRVVPIWGIALFERTNVTIKNVEIRSCIYGICLSGSSNSTITKNKIVGPSNWIGWVRRERGLYLADSVNNSIFENEIANNREGLAIELRSSVNNRIYHNNFANGTSDNISTVNSTNTWDDGYPSGGNYWSGYSCPDFFGGLYQNNSGSDGIADKSYIIDVDNKDSYPLMKPHGGLSDIGVTSVVTAKTVVGKNCKLNASFTIMNYDINAETFNVTIYANKTAIITFQSVALASRGSATFAFSWNATGIAFGNYTITAYAEPLQNETDISDNTLSSCIVRVSAVGDVNGDGKVDLKDVYLLSKTCGTSPDSPKWNSDYDVNNDGTIDLKDFYMACKNFGERC